jgi:Hypervirulence associated proteins TUDOR domain
VSWKWGSGRPSGEVAEVATEGGISIKSDKGNTIKKNASADDPAVHIAREGNDVVKRAHEVAVDEKAAGSTEMDGNAAKNGSLKENGDAKVGEKRELDNGADKSTAKENGAKAEDEAEKTVVEPKPAAKKQKTATATKKTAAEENKPTDDGVKKGRGRPKKSESNGNAKGPAKKKEPRPAATADGKPRRSARNAI